MQHGTNTTSRTRQHRPAWSSAARPPRRPPSAAGREPRVAFDAKRNYERYLELARAAAQSGDTVGAENYYQHAEHYFRTMSSDPRTSSDPRAT